MMNKLMYMVLLLCLSVSLAGADKRKEKNIEGNSVQRAASEYEKLLKGKKMKQVQGLMTLHLVDGKLFVELPLELLKKDMMLASVVSEISDHTDCYVGKNAYIPLRVYFSKIGKHVQLRRDRNQSIAGGGDINIARAIERSNTGAIMASFEIKAYSPDSTAVVFDMTKFFTGSERLISAIDPRSESKLMLKGVNYRLVDDLSVLEDVKAFENNVSVQSRLTYNSKVNIYNRYTTAVVTRTLALLPEVQMKPRLADYRLPLQVLGKWNYRGNGEILAPVYYALRWRLEPQNESAFRAGEKVEPKKPIVFYLDTLLSPLVRAGITEGLLEWNKTFDAIGYKNVIQVRDYPRCDSSFDPDNFSYNCIRYVPSLASGITVRTYADPRSGEILNTNILVTHNYVVNIPYNVFLNTAHADPSVRKRYLSDDRLKEDIKNYFAWLAGTECFGMTYNLTSSAAFSIDSLRSASFTQKYGTSPSLLDLAPYNTVAPVDAVSKGIRLTPVGVGEYDYHVVKCLYAPIPGANTPEEEFKVVEKWVSEKVGDPKYRYEYAKDCPDCGANDVGNDDLKAFKYGMENLKFMVQNFDKWITDEEDPEFDFRGSIYLMLQRQYKKMITQVAMNCYGIFTYEKKAGDPVPMYRFIDKKRQQEALDLFFTQLLRPSWLDRPDLETKMPLMRSNMEMHKDYVMLLLNVMAGKLFAYEQVEGEYITHTDYIYKLYRKLFEKTRRGEEISEEELYYQSYFFRTMMKSSQMVDRSGKSSGGASNALAEMLYNDVKIVDVTDAKELALCEERLIDGYKNEDIMAGNYGELKTWPVFNIQSTRHVYYDILKDMRVLVEKCLNSGSPNVRKHYRFMYDSISKLLD
ncbi:zinc-dependent metalloprotease [Butyricimonas synergistica]|uniref:zinc-dependent metalloprotease n=1 Tax=Butyricimonas synergistica TaxID=544644 RepID=UPI00037AC71C|nr:zinc-dependent metalloprotease [Butyricimonas synergistica]